jgi:riboflavin kinase/FMN adenylyltransferase
LSVEFIKGIENMPKNSCGKTVVTIGTYDGIHRGHQEILKRVSTLCEEQGCDPVLITFNPHPKLLVTPDNIPLLLTSIEEKSKFIPHFFNGKVLVLNFNDELKNLSAEDFVKNILIDIIQTNKVVVGYNHAFGHNRSGNIEKLKEFGIKYNFEVEVVQPVLHNDKPISSSRIRHALLNDEYELALEMLGHDYAIYGKVERGIGLGRRIGYPTANVNYDIRKLLPPDGVYACWVEVGGEDKNGMMFIGKNHFNPQNRISVEANIFDFDKDIYGEDITVHPTHFIRHNKKFDKTDMLIEEINKDKEKVLNIISKEKNNGYEQRAKSSDH